MGLFFWRRKFKDPIRGTAQVVSCSYPSHRARSQNVKMQLAVQIDGVEPYATSVHQMVPSAKYPSPGWTVPVIVSRADQSEVRVDFDSMPTNDDRSREAAERQAQAMGNGEGSGLIAQPGVTVVGDIDNVPPEKLGRLESMLGMDLNGDGTIGAPAADASDGEPGGDDRLTRLERLTELRDSGALTDAEFDQEKRRILDA